jgi:predicted alpha-1,6-mannanase (GH76 family)
MRARRPISRTRVLAGLVSAAVAATVALASIAFAGFPAASASGSARVAALARAEVRATNPASAKVRVPAQLSMAMATLVGLYFNKEEGFFYDPSHWRNAVAESAMESYQQTTGDTTYDYTFDTGQLQDSPLSFFENNYNDDTAWWGLALLQGYQINHNPSYLANAEAIANYIAKTWNNSTKCGSYTGGVPWQRSGPSYGYTGAIQNGLFLELTAWLHNTIVKNGGTDSLKNPKSYISWAMKEWNFFKEEGLFHSDLITPIPPGFAGPPGGLEPYWVPNASPTLSPQKYPPNSKQSTACGGLRYRIFTYNQGVLIAGLAQLYTATNENLTYLTDAEDIANSVLKPPTPQQSLYAVKAFFTGKSPWIFTFFGSGVLVEPQDALYSTTEGLGDGAAFKGIFVRDLRMLDDTIAHAPGKANQCADTYSATYKNKKYNLCTAMYNDFFTTQACSIEEHDSINTPETSINPEDETVQTYQLFGDRWQGPPNLQDATTQVSATEALVAADLQGHLPNCKPSAGPPRPPGAPTQRSSEQAGRQSPSEQAGQQRQLQAVEPCYEDWYRMPGCRQEHYFSPDDGRLQRGQHFYPRREQFTRGNDGNQDD